MNKTEIANLALLHVGVSMRISDFDERTKEARVIREVYDTALEEILRETKWPHASKTAPLALVSAEDEAYNGTYFYAYRYPSDCLFARGIVTNVRPDTVDSKISYEIGSDASGRLILTNTPNASLMYTFRQTDTALFPTDFCVALAYRIASLIAPTMIRDVGKLTPLVKELYALSVSKAKGTAMNEHRPGSPAESEFTRNR